MSLKVLSIVILCAVAYSVEGKIQYGGPCTFSVNCETGLRCDRTYTTCSKGTCICETGKLRNAAGKCGSLLGGDCDSSTDCSVGGGYCNTANRKCECDSATPNKATDKFCVGANELVVTDSCTTSQPYYYITKYDTKVSLTYTKTASGACGCPEDRYVQGNKCLRRPGNLIERAVCSPTASEQCVEGLDCTVCNGESQPTCRKPFDSGQDTSRAAVSVIFAGLLLSLVTMM